MRCEMVYDSGQCKDEATVDVQDETLGERHLCRVCALAMSYVDLPRWMQLQIEDERRISAKGDHD